MSNFCKQCGIKISSGGGALGSLGSFLVGGGTKTYEFEDGRYCETCAQVKVKKARK